MDCRSSPAFVRPQAGICVRTGPCHGLGVGHDQDPDRLRETCWRRLAEPDAAQCRIDRLISVGGPCAADAPRILDRATRPDPKHANNSIVAWTRAALPAQRVEQVLLNERIVAPMLSRLS